MNNRKEIKTTLAHWFLWSLRFFLCTPTTYQSSGKMRVRYFSGLEAESTSILSGSSTVYLSWDWMMKALSSVLNMLYKVNGRGGLGGGMASSVFWLSLDAISCWFGVYNIDSRDSGGNHGWNCQFIEARLMKKRSQTQMRMILASDKKGLTQLG